MTHAPDRFFNNPAFREYIFLLAELHRLIREGRDETAQGWAINNAMDGPGEQLDDEEVKAVKVLAADFHRLAERHRSILDVGRDPTSPPRSGTDGPSAVGSPVRPGTTDRTDSPRELIP